MNTKFKYTPEMLEELMQCYQDPEYFMSEHLGITSDVVESWNAPVIQSTSLTLEMMCAYAIWYAAYTPQRLVLFVTESAAARTAANTTFVEMFRKLPTWLTPQLTEVLKTRLVFENGTKVLFEVASPHVGRSLSPNLCLIEDVESLVKHSALAQIWLLAATCDTQVVVKGYDELFTQ